MPRQWHDHTTMVNILSDYAASNAQTYYKPKGQKDGLQHDSEFHWYLRPRDYSDEIFGDYGSHIHVIFEQRLNAAGGQEIRLANIVITIRPWQMDEDRQQEYKCGHLDNHISFANRVALEAYYAAVAGDPKPLEQNIMDRAADWCQYFYLQTDQDVKRHWGSLPRPLKRDPKGYKVWNSLRSKFPDNERPRVARDFIVILGDLIQALNNRLPGLGDWGLRKDL